MKPNFLIFVTDQQRADWLSCMGNTQLETPNIDRIARRGIVFDRAYCSTPLCMPSRYTMWTGLHASSHGLRTNGVNIKREFPALPEILGEAGYRTISVGKLHLRPWNVAPEMTPDITEYTAERYPEGYGVWRDGLCRKLPENYFGLQRSYFIGGHSCDCYGEYMNDLQDKHPDAAQQLKTRTSVKPSLRPDQCYYSTVPKELYYNRWMEDRTIEELEQCGDDQPFFFWCSFPDPHFPFGPPAPYHSMYQPETLDKPIAWDDDREGMNEFYHLDYYQSRGMFSVDGGPTDLTLEQIQETKALAYGMVKGVDDSVGRIMDYLERSGRLENTVVMFLSDHGELMGDHGLYCKAPFHYEGLIRVPMIISWPRKLLAGVRSGSLVSMVDVMPTILDLAGVEYPGGPEEDWKGFFSQTPLYEGVSRLPGRSLVPIMSGHSDGEREWVLIENDDDIRNLYVRTIVTKRYKLTVYQGKEYGDLFDLEQDPEERRNCWSAPEYQAVREKLLFQLLNGMIAEQNRTDRRISVS